MAAAVRINIEGIDEVRAAIRNMPDQAGRAAKRAVRTVSDWAVSQIVKDMSGKTGISQATFRDRRVKSRGIGGADRLVWGGYNTLGAKWVARAGELEAQLAENYWQAIGKSYDYGVKVGKYIFVDAFVFRMPNGYLGVFKKVGNRLEEQRVAIPEMTDVAEAIQRDSTDRLTEAFAKEMRYELSK